MFCITCGSELVEKHLILEDVYRLVCSNASCDYIHYDNPVPVVGAIVEQGENVVLIQNKEWPNTWYSIVTGFLEKGEDPKDAVLREVKEETNLDAEVVELIGIYPFYKSNQIIIIYHVRAEPGDVKINHELSDFKIVPTNKLKPWPYATAEGVRDWLNKKENSQI